MLSAQSLRFSGCLGFWMLASSCLAQSPQSSEANHQQWFVDQILRVELTAFERGEGYFVEKACAALVEAGYQEEAIELWNRCFEVLKKKGQAESYLLLDAALAMDRLDLAERILAEADAQHASMLDRMALYKFRHGQESALDGYPFSGKKLTFYDAMDLGNTYIDMGLLEELEDFLSDLDITEENDPEDAAGILYERIAADARQAGDMKTARKYIDKAYQIAGRQFYTGFSIDVTRRSIHGTLVMDVETMRDRALAYRGHMARELLQGLIAELVEIKEFRLAESTARSHLEDEADIVQAIARIAEKQAASGDYQGALGLMRELKDRQQLSALRISVAKALLQDGKREAARDLADLAAKDFERTQAFDRLYAHLAAFEGAYCAAAPVDADHTENLKRLKSAISEPDREQVRGMRLLSAFDGFRQISESSPRTPHGEGR